MAQTSAAVSIEIFSKRGDARPRIISVHADPSSPRVTHPNPDPPDPRSSSGSVAGAAAAGARSWPSARPRLPCAKRRRRNCVDRGRGGHGARGTRRAELRPPIHDDGRGERDRCLSEVRKEVMLASSSSPSTQIPPPLASPNPAPIPLIHAVPRAPSQAGPQRARAHRRARVRGFRARRGVGGTARIGSGAPRRA